MYCTLTTFHILSNILWALCSHHASPNILFHLCLPHNWWDWPEFRISVLNPLPILPSLHEKPQPFFFRLCLSSKSQVYISRSAFTYPSECTATLTGPNWGLYPPHTLCLSHLWVLSVSSILISSWSLSSLALQLKKVSFWISSLPTVCLSSRHLQ